MLRLQTVFLNFGKQKQAIKLSFINITLSVLLDRDNVRHTLGKQMSFDMIIITLRENLSNSHSLKTCSREFFISFVLEVEKITSEKDETIFHKFCAFCIHWILLCSIATYNSQHKSWRMHWRNLRKSLRLGWSKNILWRCFESAWKVQNVEMC